MATYDEQDEIIQLKRLWKDYGLPILVGLLVCLVIIYGYRGWQGHRAHQAEQASALYETLLSTVGVIPANQALSAKQRIVVDQVYQKLQADYPKSQYTAYTGLFVARFDVAAGHLKQAQNVLSQIAEHYSEVSPGQLARVRLARVMAATGQEKQALNVLENGKAGPFAMSYAVTEGDIYQQLKQFDNARLAYEKALNIARQNQLPLPTVVEMKRDNLPPPSKSDDHEDD